MVKCFVRVLWSFTFTTSDSVTVTTSMTCESVSRDAFLQKASMEGIGIEGETERVMEGVFGFVDAVMTISRSRGIPRVTLAAPCPVHRGAVSVRAQREDDGQEKRTSEMEGIERHLGRRLADSKHAWRQLEHRRELEVQKITYP